MPVITNEKTLKTALAIQRTEITEYHVYSRLAALCKDEKNAEVLRSVGFAEKKHAAYWESMTGREAAPHAFKIRWTIFLARIFGLTFILKRMERNEGVASKNYKELIEEFPEVRKISEDEDAHEKELLAMLDEELLRYVGSIVLGLNDALVELTGALAGFTLALGETRLISMAGLVTGISAAFSMAASDYLSCKADNDPKAARSALYTGGANIITVIILILPFLLAGNKFLALGITLFLAVLIIFLFNFYLATAKELNFRRRFAEMTFISLGVAALSFGVAALLQKVLGV
jgi:VIT1/CCC1 family predicted Fe2+/Mn2+ transporter